jgi:hypothetical protein
MVYGLETITWNQGPGSRKLNKNSKPVIVELIIKYSEIIR